MVASPTYNAEGRVQKTDSGYGDTSREGNEIGVLEPTRSGEHVACSRNFMCTRTQFTLHSYSHPISRSQPYSFPARPHPTRTQKKQYTSSSVGLAQARPNKVVDYITACDQDCITSGEHEEATQSRLLCSQKQPGTRSCDSNVTPLPQIRIISNLFYVYSMPIPLAPNLRGT